MNDRVRIDTHTPRHTFATAAAQTVTDTDPIAGGRQSTGEGFVMDILEAIIVDIYERELPSGLQVSGHLKINSIWGALVGDGRRLFTKGTGLQPQEAPDLYADSALEYYDRCMVGQLNGMTSEQPKPGDEDYEFVTAARAVLHDLLQADRVRLSKAAYAAALA